MFKKHLSKSKTTYVNHLKWAVLAGGRLISAGCASIMHGLIPTLFDGKPAATVIDIYHKHLKNHPNQDYQDLIDSYENDLEQ